MNAAMLGIEILAGWQARSVSLQADALDFFGDATTYAITLVVLGMGVRARAWAGKAKGVSLGLFGLWVIATTIQCFYNAGPPVVGIMGSIGLLALIVNLFFALILYSNSTSAAPTCGPFGCAPATVRLLMSRLFVPVLEFGPAKPHGQT